MVWITIRKGKLSDCWKTDYVLSFPHIEGITLGADEEVDEVDGEASGMDVDRIGEVGDRASERQTAGVYGAGFTVGARGGTRGMGNKVTWS